MPLPKRCTGTGCDSWFDSEDLCLLACRCSCFKTVLCWKSPPGRTCRPEGLFKAIWIQIIPSEHINQKTTKTEIYKKHNLLKPKRKTIWNTGLIKDNLDKWTITEEKLTPMYSYDTKLHWGTNNYKETSNEAIQTKVYTNLSI